MFECTYTRRECACGRVFHLSAFELGMWHKFLDNDYTTKRDHASPDQLAHAMGYCCHVCYKDELNYINKVGGYSE